MSELDEVDEILGVLEHPSEPRLFPAWVTDSLAEDLRAKRYRIEKWGGRPRVKRLDSEAAAVALGCSVRHVQNLVSRGELTNHGTPRRILVDLDEIDEYLAEQPRKG